MFNTCTWFHNQFLVRVGASRPASLTLDGWPATPCTIVEDSAVTVDKHPSPNKNPKFVNLYIPSVTVKGRCVRVLRVLP